jgi:hypothetical protein
LEVDSRKFYGQCGEIQKEVDFIYKDKTVIEIAGMSSDEYFYKINSAMKCIESLGYKTVVYVPKEIMNKTYTYYEFYKKICEDFNFPVDETMKSNVVLLIGHKNLGVDVMKKFIDDNIRSASQLKNPKIYYHLRMHIKKLYGKTIREYRKELEINQTNK